MKHTSIQWCHSTVNPVAGCDGCELWPTASIVKSAIIKRLIQFDAEEGSTPVSKIVNRIVGDRLMSSIYHDREKIAQAITGAPGGKRHEAVVDVIRASAKCYAGHLSTNRAGHKGYPIQFEMPKLFSGRMSKAAAWGPPSDAETSHKPWLNGCRRIIFVSDIGDALSKNVPFEYLLEEIIGSVITPEGARHIWTWLTKRPQRMAKFVEWLQGRRVEWPRNLMAMTTVTSQNTAGRINQLRRVPAKLRGLSVEPLFGPVALDLHGINWVVVGGGSVVLAEPFHLEWALELRRQCECAGCAFFLKQLGKNAFYRGQRLRLGDRHGGRWEEWTVEARIREMPSQFQS